MLTVVPPAAQVEGPDVRSAAPPLAAGPVRLALVANGKPNSAELLEAMARHMRHHLRVAEVRLWRKPSVSVPPTDQDVAEIGEWADAVLAAVGD